MVYSAYKIYGIVNVTPDSFSDGGSFFSPADAVARCEELLEAGADILDIGAESTRPQATPLSEAEEWQRLEPVLEQLARRNLMSYVSVDTYKEPVMLKAAEVGASYINNVKGLCKQEALQKLAQYPGLRYIAMHMHENPQAMQKDPLHGAAAVAAVETFFSEATQHLMRSGFTKEQILVDPGIGFGKDDAGNLQILSKLKPWSAQHRLVIGVSRKAFIGRLLGIEKPKDRDHASKMLEFGFILHDIPIVRTHDVRPLKKIQDLLLH